MTRLEEPIRPWLFIMRRERPGVTHASFASPAIATDLQVGTGKRPETPRDFLRRVAKELASLSEARETAGLNRLIFAEAFRFPELSRLFIEFHDRAWGVIREPLEAWREQGLLPNLPQPKLAAMLFVEMVASLPRIRTLLGEPMSRRESNALVQVAADIFLRGCGYKEERR